MARYVIVLEEGGCGPPDGWEMRGVLDPRSLGEGQAAAWEKLCQEVVAWAQTGVKVALEVFICVIGDELMVPPDRSSLTRLLRQARDYSWAAKVFLVVTQHLRPEKITLDGKESRELWLRAAFEGKALDILQVEFDPERPELIKREALRSAADQAYARHEALAIHTLSDGAWFCIVDPAQKQLQWFLSTWMQGAQAIGLEENPNLVIVIDDLRESKQRAAVRKALRHNPMGRHLVVTLCPAPELQGICQSLKLPAPIELRGPFELWYFMLRLNEGRRSLRLRPAKEIEPTDSLGANSNGCTFPVELEGSPVFDPGGEGDPPIVVITSAFNPEEPGQCFDAARDVGWFVERCPLGHRVLVEPAMTLGRLFQVMERWRDFNVWVHLGHADGADGLEEAGTDRMATPQEVLRCFQGREHGLALAMFLSCRSAPIAALFAQAGAGVAIGFEEEVESDMCRELAVEVLNAMLADGTGQASILRGFSLGCHRIEVQEESPSLPVAYYPRLS
jgi:hypothetical protein